MTTIERFARRVAAVSADRTGGAFLLLSAAVGVAVGAGAWALVEVLQLIGGLLFDGNGVRAGNLWLLVVLPLGFLAAWAIARYFAPEVPGDGVPEAIASLAVRGGRIRGRVAPLKILATGLTLGTGGSAGREGPIVLIGASIGSKLASVFRLGEDQVRSLVAAGAAAGIGASFNAPIAGMLFGMEVILSSFAVRHISAIVVASVAAAITSRELDVEQLVLSAERYALGDWRELILYAGLALVVVAFAVLFLKLLERTEEWVHQGHRSRSWLRPVGFGVATAAIVLVEPMLLGTDQARLVGTGQDVTNQLLESATGVSAVTFDLGAVWWILALVALGKIVATTLTLASGASGGAFMPSLFVGAMVGTAFAKLVGPLWTAGDLSTGSFAVVGMATMFAATGRAPLTAILLVFEVTGTREYGLILPLMLAAILATFLTDRLHPESVYTMPLRRRGIARARQGEVDILDTVSVGRVMTPARLVVGLGTRLQKIRADLDRHRAHGAPVIDGDGELVGIVTVTDLSAAKEPDTAVAADVMTPRPITVTPQTPVSQAMARMAGLGVGRLPVVADDDPSRLVGMFRREDAVRAYHEALGTQTDHALQRARLAQRTQPGAGYYDFRVPVGSVADGRAVRDVAWPEGSTLVSVRRGLSVLIPVGSTLLQADDVVTAFGSEASREIMIERMNAGADEPTAEIDVVVVGEDEDEGVSAPTLGGDTNSGDGP